MKKNLFSIIIIALLVMNLVLTGVLVFSIIPASKKTNELVSKVCSAIDLELESNRNSGVSNVPIDKIQVYDIADSMTINLKNGDDNKEHYAVVSVSLSLNTEHDDYSTYGEKINEKESLIKNEIRSVVASYTLSEIKSDPDAVTTELLKRIQALFNSDFIVSVAFRDVVFQ